MRIGARKDPTCAYYGQIEVPDDLEICAICRKDIWPGEAVGWSENNQICHAWCVEKENQNGSEKTC